MLSFGSASMLWWSLAAVIPFVLHLWNRKPKQVVPFAATRFLVAATKRQSKRIKFQQWILLLARVAILLLFALALADPRWGSSASTIQGAVATHQVLVIDDSYSMSAKVDSETRLELAKARLIQLVQAAPVGDLFSLVAMGSPPEIVIAGPSHDRAEMEQAIEAVQVRQVGAKIAPALSVVRRLIEDGQSMTKSPRASRVTIASDLAKNTWGEVTPEQIDAQVTNAAPGCSWSLISSGDEPLSNNLAITDLSARTRTAYFGQTISGEIVIANTGVKGAESAMVEILAGDRVLFQTDLSLNPNQQRSIPWQIAEQREPLLLVARIGSDDLGIDNRRYLNLDVRPAPRVLCLASSAEAARHVVMALTSGAIEMRPRVDVKEVNAEGSLKSMMDLSEYDAILLLNLPPPMGDLAKDLKLFVERGGGVLIGLGDRANLTASDVYPAELGPFVKLEAPRFDPLNYEHPLMAAFRDAPEVGLLSLPVWRYCKLEKVRPSAKVAARFGSGDVALIEETRGRGKVVLFAGSLGAESIDVSENPPVPWTGLPGSAAYVPMIQEWVMRCAAKEPEPDRIVGDPPPSFFSGSEKRGISNGEAWRTISDDDRSLAKAGFYRAEVAITEPSVFNVNIDARESWHESERSRFAQWIDAEAPEAIVATTSAQRTYRSLSTWFLIPLALLVCGEIVLATLMRRSKRPLVRNGGVV